MARSIAGAAPGRTNRRFLILAIAFAGLSAGLIYAWMASNSSGGGDEANAPSGTQQVVVAAAPIKPRTAITEEMLTVKSIPINAVVTGGYATKEEVIGKVTKLPLESNQQVIGTAIVDTDQPLAEALSLVVPNGRRAFSINASPVVTAGGLLLPGDYVDVIWVCCEQGLKWSQGGTNPGGSGGGETDAIVLAKTVVQNVQVAAVAQAIVSSGPVASGDGTGIDDDPVASENADENPEAITITLLVTPEQSHLLLMAESTGELRAALRGIGDTQTLPPNADYTLTTPGLIPDDLLQQLIQRFGGAAQ